MTRAITLTLLLAVLVDGAALMGQRGGAPTPPNPPARQGGAGPVNDGRGGRGRGAGPFGRDRVPATGTAIIRGRVVAADTGMPVRRADIQASVAGERPRGALTDGEGRFELRNLPAGSWTIRASKAGFVTQQFGQRSPFGASEPIALSDAQQFTAEFSLLRGGAITGRVYDEYGDPVAGTRLSAVRVQTTSSGRRLVPTGSTSTSDDTGAYRIYGLPPGEYYVSANVTPPAGSAPLAAGEGPVTYATMYFPGTPDYGSAQRVAVGAGQEQSSINMTLTPVRAVRVSGVVIGLNGNPLPAIVNLRNAAVDDGPSLGERNTGSGADGSFALLTVPPGNYLLDVTSRGRGDAAVEVASVPLTVGTEDITGLTITTSRGATVKGTITADDGTRLQTSDIRVSAPPLRGGFGARPARVQATSDGRFDLDGLIGPRTFRFDQLPSGWVVKSVAANGVDVSDVALDFRGTEDVALRVVLTNHVAELSGHVKSDAPLRGASILVFPDDETKWTYVSRYLRTTRTDDNGQFTLHALPPHQRYLAAAFDYLDTGENLDPDFLRRVKPLATGFALTEGEKKSLELTLTPHP